jgi:predicted transcriptional regulator of viral defense system
MRKEGANRERVIADLAAKQHGVVSARQLAAAGLPDYSVTRRVKAGRLHRLHRGVYAVGHRHSPSPRVASRRCLLSATALSSATEVPPQCGACCRRMPVRSM